jgi:hypothetical protein
MPAAEATIPRLLESDQLEGGNAAMMGADQLASFVGPVAAGLLIAAFSSGATGGGAQAGSLLGIGAAFAVDALSFAISAASLAWMRPIPAARENADTHPLADVLDGLRYSMGNAHIRAMFLAIASANFLIMGPIFVGLPVLVQGRLCGGAAAFGFIMAAVGVGSLLGMIAAGALPRPTDRLFTWLAVAMFMAFAVAVGALGFITSSLLAAALLFTTGLGNGYIAVIAMTALQRMTPRELLGRVMSLIMLAIVGLAPVSQAISGAVIRISPEVLFGGAGIGFVLVAIWTAMQRDVWTLGDGEPTEEGGDRPSASGSARQLEVEPTA